MSPANSESQRRLFCVALSIKRGETAKSYSKQAAQIADENDEATLKEFCESKVRKE